MSKDMVIVLAILGVGGAFLYMQSQKVALAAGQTPANNAGNSKDGGSQVQAPADTFNTIANGIGALFAGFEKVANQFNERN